VGAATLRGVAGVEVRPFTEGDIGGAGSLLARRHAAHRVAQPLLARRFEAAADASGEVAMLWQVPGASGAVAGSAGRMVGFVLGVPRSREDWGSNVWVQPAGHAAEEAETVRDLYAFAARQWVDEGRTAHYALVPAWDGALVDAWFRLGFGQQHVHALRPVGPPEPATAREGLRIRRAGAADVPALAALDLLLPAHHRLSPVFSAAPVPALAEALDDWADDIGDPSIAAFVAERDGAVIGSAFGCPVERSTGHAGLARPYGAGLFAFAAVEPPARGAGIGSALGRAVLAWMAETGYRAAVTDWRATNLLSSRTWPRLGYQPTFLRLHRTIG
jgi:GNAT superfamily N-acetyltransferase